MQVWWTSSGPGPPRHSSEECQHRALKPARVQQELQRLRFSAPGLATLWLSYVLCNWVNSLGQSTRAHGVLPRQGNSCKRQLSWAFFHLLLPKGFGCPLRTSQSQVLLALTGVSLSFFLIIYLTWINIPKEYAGCSFLFLREAFASSGSNSRDQLYQLPVPQTAFLLRSLSASFHHCTHNKSSLISQDTFSGSLQKGLVKQIFKDFQRV